MARRKRAKTRTVYKKVARRVKKASSKPQAVIIPAMIYGALREKASMSLVPITSKIPMGEVADEIGMGVLSYLIAKKGKGMIKKVGLAGLTIESARAGEFVAQTGLGGLTSSGSAPSQNVYG